MREDIDEWKKNDAGLKWVRENWIIPIEFFTHSESFEWNFDIIVKYELNSAWYSRVREYAHEFKIIHPSKIVKYEIYYLYWQVWNKLNNESIWFKIFNGLEHF